MKNELIRKGLVFGMVLLFVGTSVVSATIFPNQSKARDNNQTVKIAESTVYNLIGGVNISFDFHGTRPAVNFTWWINPDRNFTYPITNGKVNVNYTFEVQFYSIGVFFIPRFAGLISTLYYPENIMLGEGVAVDMVPFWQTKGDYDKFMYVECDNPIPTPPPDVNKTNTKFFTWNQAGALTITAEYGQNSYVKKFFHHSEREINFWATFI